MHFSSILFLAASVLAAPLTSRDVNSISTAITNIEAKVTQMNNTVNMLNGNPMTALKTVLAVEENNAELSDAVKAAVKTVQASQPLSSSDSGTIAVAILGFAPQITSLLSNIVAHKKQFDTAVLGVGSVSPQVHLDLVNQNATSSQFATALVAKLSPNYAALAPLVTNQIFAAFANAINVFSKSGGLFALPAVNGLGEFEELLKKYM